MSEGSIAPHSRPETRITATSPLLVPRQQELFPLSTVLEFPDCLSTADAWGRVIASDSLEYVVKLDKGGLGIRASDWMGTHIAEAANMPCPTPKVVELRNGELAFGSRLIAGVEDAAVTAAILTSGASPPGLASSLSGVFALDMFLNNVDRHDQNYLMVSDRGVLRLYTLDFGRSLFYLGGLDKFPLPTQQTRLTAAKLRRRHGFDLSAAKSVLERIAGISVEHISSIIRRMPEVWLPNEARHRFVEWWANGQQNERILTLRKGLEDGTLL